MKQILTITFTALVLIGYGQHFKSCKIYQYKGLDSLNKKLVSEEMYNSKGLLITDYKKDYLESSTVSYSDSRNFYLYRDTLLLSESSINEDNDSSKVVYQYNAAGKKIKEEHFSYERRLKKDVDKGYGRPGGCIVTDKDYEKKRTWEKISEINFSYDTNGNMILYDATKLHYTSQNKYTWSYDQQNRITEQRSYDDDVLIWVEKYEYGKDKYKFSRTWYDHEGNAEHLKKKDEGYWPQYSFYYTLNAKGKVTEEKVMNEKGEITSREETHYDAAGRIAKVTKFDNEGKADITHIYMYE